MTRSVIKPILSIIIVSFRSLDVLIQCIASIIKFNDIEDKVEIIVVDDGNPSDSYDWIKQNYPEIRAIKVENKGFGFANNRGAEISCGEFLLFLNPDTLLVEPIFQYAIDKFQNNPELGMFGIKLIDAKGNRNISYGPRFANGLVDVYRFQILNKFHHFSRKSMCTSGADIFIRRAAFFDIGSFDENFFMYCEEGDLSNRLEKKGYVIDYFPQKKIIHLEGTSTGSDFITIYKRTLKSKLHYCEKYNISINEFLNKEISYCKLKKRILTILGKQIQASQYGDVIKLLRAQSPRKDSK